MRAAGVGGGLALLATAGLTLAHGLPGERVGNGDAPTVSRAAPTAPEARTATAAAPPGGPALRQEEPELPYDGRFTFVRLRFESGRSGLRGFGFGGRREPPWHHDRPRAEVNFAKIIEETTFVGVRPGAGKVLEVDDPELFRYPVAYIVEVGFWDPSDEEIAAMGEYLRKGGFLIVDDFRGSYALSNFARHMRRALPELHLQEVPDEHEIFDSFFHIDDPMSLVPPYSREVPDYLAIFEENDPAERLMVMVNYNNDMAEYWEYSDYGYYPIDLSNEAYKFGVNYLVYAMTH